MENRLNAQFETQDYALFFNDHQLLTNRFDAAIFLPIQDVCLAFNMALHESDYFYLGEFHQRKLYAAHVSHPLESHAHPYQLRSTRDILSLADTESCQHIHRGKQLLAWHQSSLFCGKCGTKTHLSDVECCKICPGCEAMIYPTTSPAIIVLIYHEDKLLLGRSPHFPPQIYSNLAGFVEPGESCEAAIHREVDEEVGVKIKNIEYIASQSCPFPNSFMIGFKAEYAGGSICVNTKELEDARWFSIANLPPLPATCSIARHMIDDFVARSK